MKKNLFIWLIYSIGFGVLLTPLFIRFGLLFFEIASVSLSIGFFAGILNAISSELKSINNQLRERT